MDALQRIENAEKELAAAKAELAKGKVTYSIGDRFKTKRDEKYILCPPKSGSFVALFNLKLGTRIDWQINVPSVYCVPAEKLTLILEEWGLTRYWDNRKQEKV